MTDFLEEALSLAHEGFSIFPLHRAVQVDDVGTILCTCGKSGNITDPKTCRGKHPQIGIHPSEDATTDPVIIRGWWSKWSNAPIGIHLGKSHVWGLDIDPRHGGDGSLQRMIAEHGELPETRLVKTGGDGLHYYFAAWTEKIHNGILPDYPGIDIKGNEGTAYLVAPPSDHVSGNRYEYIRRVLPLDAPDWLLAMVKKGNPKTGSVSGKGLPSESITKRRDTEVCIHRLLTAQQLSLLHNEGTMLIGNHPVHGSTTGRNFTINLNTNRWHCYRHQSGGGLLELSAVLTGICRCEEFTSNNHDKSLTGRKFVKSIDEVLNLGITEAELIKHLKTGRRGQHAD